MTTNSDLQLEVNHLRNKVEAQDHEIEVLTQERDNAAVRIRELELQVSVLTSQAQEAELLEAERDNALLRIEELERDIARPYGFQHPSDKGGVHPNA